MVNRFVNMTDSLHRLCEGNYRIDDVTLVVSQFSNMAKVLIARHSHLKRLTNEWSEFQSEIEDVALDYIAPLFARDETGVFIELKKYFDPVFTDDSPDIESAVERLIYSIIHQESIRIYENRDPVGRIFYRSLRYIMSKHPEWTKEKKPDNSVWIRSPLTNSFDVPETRITEAFKIIDKDTAGLTKTIERGLIELICRSQCSVPVKGVLNTIRQQLKPNGSYVFNGGDPDIELTVDYHIGKVLTEIDETILVKYVKDRKMVNNERKGFLAALEHVLTDFQRGENGFSYFEYLSKHLPQLTQPETYQKDYRKQFEYVAKKAKRTFSAHIKSDFRLE